jgi:preprotein translocase subunit YajC
LQELFVLDFLISPAYAQAAAPGSQSFLGAMWPLLVMIPLFYFMLIRPQMKRAKEHRELLASITKGDEVVTSGGLAGKVSNISEAYVTVEIADNVNIKVQKQAISSVLPKGTLKSL